jgi:hypothetical protein
VPSRFFVFHDNFWNIFDLHLRELFFQPTDIIGNPFYGPIGKALAVLGERVWLMVL